MYTVKQLAEEALRELDKREEVFPRWIREGKIKSDVAHDRIEKMRSIYRTLIKLDDAQVVEP